MALIAQWGTFRIRICNAGHADRKANGLIPVDKSVTQAFYL